MGLQAIKYKRGKLEILDQIRLPHEQIYVRIKDPQDGWDAIKSMQVRGAPAIAIVAALSLAAWLPSVEILNRSTPASVASVISNSLKFLVTSRPTAVNLLDAARKLDNISFAAQQEPEASHDTVVQAYMDATEQMLRDDISDNESIGRNGVEWIQNMCLENSSDKQVSVITHCNTGSLATAGHGTALGVVRSLHNNHLLRRVFYTETRPYNQGARLTGFELIHDQMPAELITDSMAAALLRHRKQSENIVCIVVGADRVAANGDTANKIGTYNLAIVAKHHGIKFLVAAPRTTIDLDTACGEDIVIERRSSEEMTTLKGPVIQVSNGTVSISQETQRISIAPLETCTWNPSFDVTPANLIDGIITEKGVVEKNGDGNFRFDSIFEGKQELHNQSLTDKQSFQPTHGDGPSISWDQVTKLKSDQHKTFAQWMRDLGTPIDK